MWEVWEWNGQYIKGNLLKGCKTKDSAVKYAKKTIEYEKIVKSETKGEFYLEDDAGIPVGLIINNKERKK